MVDTKIIRVLFSLFHSLMNVFIDLGSGRSSRFKMGLNIGVSRAQPNCKQSTSRVFFFFPSQSSNLILVKERYDETMEDTTWEHRLQALTHVLTSPTNNPPFYSQFFIANQIPCYLNWDYPPILCTKDTSSFPPLHLRWGFSLFLKRISRSGLPETSWRSRCPYQQPPPLILAKGLEEAQWGDEQRRQYFRKRLCRKRLFNNVNPLIPILVPNLFLFALLLWNPFPDLDS